LGQSKCLSLNPVDDPEVIDNEQKLVSEMKLLLYSKGFSSFEGLTDTGPILKSCRADGSYLEPETLLSILRIAEAIKQSEKFISDHQTLCPRLYDLTKDVPLFEKLKETIKKAISPDGAIRDSASALLKKIRRQKTLFRRDLQKKLEDIKRSKGLTSNGDDHLISIRDGRYVIPLRTDLKNRVNGIIHNYSQTQATCFFEPAEVIQDNNRLTELSHHEKEEELRILASLTSTVMDSAEDLDRACMLLGQLDGLRARAQLSQAMKCVRPIMSQDGGIDLRQAKNPILLALDSGEDSTVPVDILLVKDQNVMIISGPNRGGKTVTLKTLGLLSLMAQAGLHIPAAEGSTLPVFKNIMAEIGDDQDILAGLSTFSAHVMHLKSMMEHADQESLIIIDEPGMGTDPDAGAALAMAVMDELSQKGSLVAVSTHSNRLKTYGLLNEKAKNVCMEFDAATNRPTFTLRYGTPGTSYAFEIARDSGIRPTVLDRAKEYLDEDEVRLNRLIDKLNRLTQKATLEKEEAEHIKTKYHSAREKVLETIVNLESRNKTLLEEKRNEADQLIKQAREEFKGLINTLKERGESAQATAKKGYDQIRENLVDNLSIGEERGKQVEINEFKKGRLVRHKRLRQEGTILSLDTYNSKAMIMAGNVKLSVDLQDLEVVSTGKGLGETESSRPTPFRASGGSAREINLIGYRVADALPLIDKMLDRAAIEGELSLRIIHGYGTGALKAAIREHLRNFPYVKKISGADPQSGGEAITVVVLG
ncbi:MAG: Smr/MutS family protein, partial [Desulfatiglandales bacterium]